jgi:hypothetical protein
MPYHSDKINEMLQTHGFGPDWMADAEGAERSGQLEQRKWGFEIVFELNDKCAKEVPAIIRSFAFD